MQPGQPRTLARWPRAARSQARDVQPELQVVASTMLSVSCTLFLLQLLLGVAVGAASADRPPAIASTQPLRTREWAILNNTNLRPARPPPHHVHVRLAAAAHLLWCKVRVVPVVHTIPSST